MWVRVVGFLMNPFYKLQLYTAIKYKCHTTRLVGIRHYKRLSVRRVRQTNVALQRDNYAITHI
jgi:hypothetical protein